ncbi:ribonucleotide reductase N-terminal alpha domain-containing protein [Thermosulfurimonas sp.]|uniref:ribonucleotide reductase N-terminal alpha domain-containing protein n=1 Tax=Thermosulfurimonas sp. TaxID=2080236 RepID=UPI0025FC2E4F|nr:ribonucleotide reductase N-terminal alpha domain-containing protein [Thermosulfurimonas sp.]
MKLPRTELPLRESALRVLAYRYLVRDEKGQVVETPEEMFWRVARAVAEAERIFGEDPEEWAERFYRLLASLDFLPNSPTLMNAGLPLGQLSACFVLPVEDSLEAIFEALKAAALIHKSGGGTGFSFSRLRPRGDVVRSTQGVASGPVSFMRVFNAATEAIKQGGKRRGANMGILRIDHPDIEEFIRIKSDPAELTNFNLSVAITDAFMEAWQKDEFFPLINPRTGREVRRVKARKLFDLLVENAWRTGDPGVIFIDTINRANPTPLLGEIESTNPCLPGDTWIMTSEGPRRIKDLLHRPFISRLDGRDYPSPEGFFSTGRRSLYLLRTREGFTLRATENHPLLRISGLNGDSPKVEWVAVRRLRPGDRLRLNAHLCSPFWPGKGGFEEGYLLGLLCARGDLKEDRPRKKEDREGAFLRDLARDFGLESGGVSPALEQASSSFYRGFLRALFDTAASLRNEEEGGLSLRLTLSEGDLLQMVQRMLLRLGIFSRLEPSGPGSLPEAEGGKTLIVSGESLRRFEERVGFSHPGRKRRLRELLSRYGDVPEAEEFVVEVSEILPAGEEEVYDCRVPGINAFDANGFVVHNCGEQPLLPYESCNLGSINLSRFVREGRVDYPRLRETVHLAVRFLDDVIEVNRFPLPQIARMTRLTRKIGLGVMGFADMLIQMGIPYSSDQAVRVAEEVMAFIERESLAESQRLAEKRGSFPAFPGSIWDRKGFPALRNATTTTIAPTGTLSLIAGTSSGIEPLFALVYRRRALDGVEWTEVHPGFLRALEERGLYREDLIQEILETGGLAGVKGIPEDLRRLFVTAFEIPPERHLAIQAAFQRHTHNAVSKTVNLPAEASREEVARIYLQAYTLGLKGVTVYRYGSRPEQVLRLARERVCPECGEPLSQQPYCVFCTGCPHPECG